MDKETAEIIKAAEEQGFTVTYSKKGHPVFHKDGEFVTTLSGTASDWRSGKNGLAFLKRAGLAWPPPSKKEQRAARNKD